MVTPAQRTQPATEPPVGSTVGEACPTSGAVQIRYEEPWGRPVEQGRYGARELPSITRLEQLNALSPSEVRTLAKRGKLDRLITDINDLKGLRSDVLHALFETGHAPEGARFNGQMRGTDLAAPHHDGTRFGRFVSWIMTTWHPWAGKRTLERPGEGHEGTGNNSVFGGWIFNFNWDVVDSKLGRKFDGDGAQVIRLDYGTPDDRLNKLTGVNCVHDEMREVGKPGSGVFLGMAALKDNSRVWSLLFNGLLRLAGRDERVKANADPVPIIYFALQGNAPKTS